MSVEVAAQIQMAELEHPKSSQGVYELPCGYLDAEGKIHTEVVLREMTGAEEDLLASKQISPSKKFSELISRCVTRIGTVTDRGQISAIVRQLPIGDRVFLLFAIRRVTLGDNYPFSDKCPNDSCGIESVYKIDLSVLEVKKMPDPLKRIYDITLPSGDTARFRVSTGEDEERVSKFEKSADAISQSVLMRLEQLNGLPPTLEAVKAMGWKDRQALRSAWDKVEGGVETEMEMQCPRCGHEFKRDVQVGLSFFYPSEA